ncbi:MAG: amidohydrolase family protein [Jiangellaceae bacterium]|nr:amidohydrolase family protein [Jiangellaceae bacterium]
MPRMVLLRGGNVYSASDPFATALLVVGERVAWVGGEGAAQTHVDSADEVVQLEGALVTPAFVDAHVHVMETGLARDGVDLSNCVSLAECLDRVVAHARSRPSEPVFGHGWDERSWPEARPPTRTEVDRATGGAVAYLSRVDVHSAVVSSALLDAVPAVLHADGYDGNGLVRRQAHHTARRATRDTLPPARRARLQRDTLWHAVTLGIGSVHEIGAPHIADDDDLRGVFALTRDEPSPEVIGYWGEAGPHGIAVALRAGCAGAAGDLNIDGSLGSRTALLSAPYADAAAESGACYVGLDEATEHVVACTAAGVQAGFHCIGDAAVRIAVSAMQRAAERCGTEAVIAAHHRLEHVEMIAPRQVAEMARLGVAASVQPRFDELWGGLAGMYATRLGADRAVAMNPFASMARAGVTLAFGSDSPVTPLGGWEMVRAAAYHRTLEHRLSVRAAFAAATRGGWRAAGVADAGVLAPGMLASYAVWEVPGELVVTAPDERIAAWSTDPRSGVPGLPELTPGAPLPVCLQTVVRGRTVFRRDGTPAPALASD